MLLTQAGFTQADIERLNAGEVVVVPRATDDKQVVSVTGMVRIKGSPVVTLEQFRESLSQRRNTAKSGGGPFSVPPEAADIASMVLSDKDLADLRQCRVGDCGINLNARAIERFRTEVDWTSSDHRGRAEQLMREVLMGYAADYLSGGDRALGRFDSRKGAPELAAVHRESLDDTILLKDLEPALFAHVADFPASRQPGVEDEVGWSAVDFGLKPMVVLTHSAIYSRPDGTLYAIAAKQFYANHYLDSSLAVTYLLRAEGTEGPELFLLFTDRSRSNTLGGMLGSMARGLVEKEAIDRVASMLDTAHLNILAADYRQNEAASVDVSDSNNSFLDWLMQPWLLFWIGLLLIMSLLLFRRHLR